jgi:hypothetical protein
MNQAHMQQGDMPIRDTLARMRHLVAVAGQGRRNLSRHRGCRQPAGAADRTAGGVAGRQRRAALATSPSRRGMPRKPRICPLGVKDRP